MKILCVLLILISSLSCKSRNSLISEVKGETDVVPSPEKVDSVISGWPIYEIFDEAWGPYFEFQKYKQLDVINSYKDDYVRERLGIAYKNLSKIIIENAKSIDKIFIVSEYRSRLDTEWKWSSKDNYAESQKLGELVQRYLLGGTGFSKDIIPVFALGDYFLKERVKKISVNHKTETFERISLIVIPSPKVDEEYVELVNSKSETAWNFHSGFPTEVIDYKKESTTHKCLWVISGKGNTTSERMTSARKHAFQLSTIVKEGKAWSPMRTFGIATREFGDNPDDEDIIESTNCLKSEQ